jgi:methylthioribose-1-phosphate isomerase
MTKLFPCFGLAEPTDAHGIPFSVAVPSSTFHLPISNDGKIPVEQTQEIIVFLFSSIF